MNKALDLCDLKTTIVPLYALKLCYCKILVLIYALYCVTLK